MKLLEKVIYASVLFLAIYVIVSLGLRLFEITSVFNSHLIGGVLATVAAILLFMYMFN